MKIMKPIIKQYVRSMFNIFGYDIRRLRNTPIRSSMGETYKLIRNLGFMPATIIDVGVAKGTYELYRAFPSSYILLVEPLEEFVPYLISIKRRYNADYIFSAAGSNNGEITINVHGGHLHGSSILKEAMGAEADGQERIVPIIKIEDAIHERKKHGPFLIKIDVQGAEIEVLKGCSQLLNDTEAIVLEVSMFEFMKDGPQFYDIVYYMKSIGFVAYDIIHGWNRPLDNALGQIDIMFVQEESKLRKSHHYSILKHLQHA